MSAAAAAGWSLISRLSGLPGATVKSRVDEKLCLGRTDAA